jgi:hypothetical protein
VVAASLRDVLVPTGRAAKIGALLRHGGLEIRYTPPGAGTIVINWYQVPPGAMLAKRAKAKPVLVAAGRLTIASARGGKIAIRLTPPGRRLLQHSHKVKLVARGFFTTGGHVVSATKSFVLER